MSPDHSRRQFMKVSAMAAAACAGTRALAADGSLRRVPISIQLYSVRDACAKDFPGTLEALAKLGFEGVEFAGYHNYANKPKILAERMDALKLKAAATHVGRGFLRKENLQQTIEFHQQIGCHYLIVPMDGDFTHPEKSKALAEFFNETAAALKPHGMACGYHNHKVEFDKAGDVSHWELFAKRTTQEVVLQLDCGWAAAAGEDCVKLIRSHPGRMKVVHLKPTVFGESAGKKAIFGQDSVNWPPILDACREVGGTQWFTLEQEVYPDGLSSMDASARSFAALKSVL